MDGYQMPNSTRNQKLPSPMSRREVIVASSRAQSGPFQLAPRYRTYQWSYSIDCGHIHAQILPAHVVESLSRGLALIPLYTEKYLDNGTGTLLDRAGAFSLDARATLRRSLCVINDIRIALPQLLRILEAEGQGITQEDYISSRELVDKLACITESTSDALSHVYHTARAIEHEMATHIRQISNNSVPRWTKAARIGSIFVSLPAFAAAVLSAIWNSSHPMLAFIMALVSATTAMCGVLGPCIVQWYCEKVDKGPPRADVQAVRVETHRLCYPLSLIMAWWFRLAAKFQALAKWTEDRTVEEMQSIAEDIYQYSREMQGILHSVESEIVQLGDAGDVV